MKRTLLLLLVGVLVAGPAFSGTEILLEQSDRSHQKLGGVGDAAKTSTTLSTTLACEDIVNNICIVEERYSVIPVGGTTAAITADQLYKSGTGYVRSIQCYGNDNAATAGTIALLDNTVAGAGDTLWSRTILAADYSINGFKADIQAPFAVGLYLDFTTTADMTCMVQYR